MATDVLDIPAPAARSRRGTIALLVTELVIQGRKILAVRPIP